MTPANVFVTIMGASLRPVAVTFDWCCAAHVAEALRETGAPVWTDSLDTEGAVIPRWDFEPPLIVLTPNMDPVGDWDEAEPQPAPLERARCQCGGQVYVGTRHYMRRPFICRQCRRTFSDSAIQPLLDAYPPPWDGGE